MPKKKPSDDEIWLDRIMTKIFEVMNDTIDPQQFESKNSIDVETAAAVGAKWHLIPGWELLKPGDEIAEGEGVGTFLYATRMMVEIYMAIKEGEALLESFIPFHLGREFKRLQFLKRLRQPHEF